MSRAERLKAMSEQRKKLRKLKPKYEIGDKVKWKTPQPILFFKEPIPEGAIFKGTVEAICKHASLKVMLFLSYTKCKLKTRKGRERKSERSMDMILSMQYI